MKKLISLLLCCALVLPAALGGVLAEQSDAPLLRVRYAVDEAGELVVRGSINPDVPDAAEKIPDDTTLKVVVFSDESTRAMEKTVTVSEGKFTARFELHGVYSAIRVYAGEQSVAKVTGPIYVGVTPPTQVPPPTDPPTPPPTAAPEAPSPTPSDSDSGESTTGPEGGDTGTDGVAGSMTGEGGNTGADGATGSTTGEGGDTSADGATGPATGEGGDTSADGAIRPAIGEGNDIAGEGGADGATGAPTEAVGAQGDIQQLDSTLLDATLLNVTPSEADLTMGIMAFSNAIDLTAWLSNPATIGYTVKGDQGLQVAVMLLKGGSQIASAKVKLPSSKTGTSTYTGFFVISALGDYEVHAEYVGEVGSLQTADVLVEATLEVDPISDASAVVMGRTSPYLQVEVVAYYDGAAVKATTQADFRGAFYVAMARIQRWGEGITIHAYYEGGKISKHVLVERARNLPTYPNDLRYGQHGTGVYEMQLRLKALGYDVDANSHFDEKTLKAVLDFQRLNHLLQDGVGGPVTRALMFSVTAREYTTAAIGTAGVLAYGDEGAAVKTLQQGLRTLKYYSGSISGLYRSGTRSAVRDFERRNKLPVDGIADQAMQALLFSASAKKGPGSSSSDSGSSSSSSSSSNSNSTSDVVVDASQYSAVLTPASNELRISSDMVFGAWDTLLEKTLTRGKLRVEAESGYSLLDVQTPGMLLRATYVDANGNAVPCRVRWSAFEGKFITRDDQRGVISEQSSPYIAYPGEIYWSLTPFMEAMAQGANVQQPTLGQDNMIFWLNKPLMSAQSGRQWRVSIEALDLYSDQLVLDSAELVMVLGAEGVVTLDSASLIAEGWTISALPGDEDQAESGK